MKFSIFSNGLESEAKKQRHQELRARLVARTSQKQKSRDIAVQMKPRRLTQVT